MSTKNAKAQASVARSPAGTGAVNTLNCDPGIGIFFDGTGNNRYVDGEAGMSNVARLFLAYDAWHGRRFRRKLYVIGVGTSEEPSDEGLPRLEAFLESPSCPAEGAREVISDLRKSGLPSLRAVSADIAAATVTGVIHLAASKTGKEVANLPGNVFGAGGRVRVAFALDWLRKQLDEMGLARDVPVDVFGFSRGASLARVFTNRLRDDAGLSGRATLRFLGIFDTVGSFGIPGDDEEAALELKLHPADAAKTVHFVARAEYRAAFPLTRVDGGQTVEFLGAHSDIGGSYAPAERKRTEELSMAPEALSGVRLNHLAAFTLRKMFEHAAPFKVPFDAQEKADILRSSLHWGGGKIDMETLESFTSQARELEDDVRALLTPSAALVMELELPSSVNAARALAALSTSGRASPEELADMRKLRQLLLSHGGMPLDVPPPLFDQAFLLLFEDGHWPSGVPRSPNLRLVIRRNQLLRAAVSKKEASQQSDLEKHAKKLVAYVLDYVHVSYQLPRLWSPEPTDTWNIGRFMALAALPTIDDTPLGGLLPNLGRAELSMRPEPTMHRREFPGRDGS
jgi:hypothetical protein